MTIENARKLLGESVKKLKDEEIQEIIDCFSGIIEVGLLHFERKYKLDLEKREMNL